MVKKIVFSLLMVLPLLQSCNNPVNTAQLVLPSPNAAIHLYFNLNKGEPYYMVYFKNKMVIDWSLLGVLLKDEINFTSGLQLLNASSISVNSDEVMEMAGELSIRKKFNELVISLSKPSQPQQILNIIFRAFDDGVAISYQFDKNSISDTVFIVLDETQLDLAGNEAEWMVLNKTDSIINEMSVEKEMDFDFPACFISADSLILAVTETRDTDYPLKKIKKRSESNPEFNIPLIHKDGETVIPFFCGTYAPWKFILISENQYKK
jgi:alpha-glucosidase